MVVDNGSTDGSREMVRFDHKWAELIEPDENLGFGRAVNLASRQSMSPWLAAANADIELRPGALEALVNAGEGAPEAGAIAPRLVLADGSTQHSVHRFPSPGLAALSGFGIYRLSARLGDELCIDGYWNPDRRRQVDWAHGAFLLIRRACFDQVGGFDESQWMYAEDIDIAWRLARAGHPVRYEPSAKVRHAVSASALAAFGSWESDRRKYAASYGWLERRRGVVTARLTAGISVAGELVRFLVFSLMALVAPGRWRRPKDRARRYLALHRIGLRSMTTRRRLAGKPS
jgi:GT2 family glycosyltransferase